MFNITQDPQQTLTAGKPVSPASLGLIVGLNLIPLVGVLNWGWQSFDLIFLYWMENLVIGAFTAARMVVRPYGNALALIFPLFLAPFFIFHYGAFCWGHGTFIISLFGPETMNGFDLLPAVVTMLSSELMLVALIALATIQALDWLRDVRQQGFGGDSAMTLMIHPYRRIVVLHVTILAAGFALAALNEPMLGLVILVLVKIGSDLWHWRKADVSPVSTTPAELTPVQLAELEAQFPKPVLTVNGVEKEFASFTEMANSKEFRMARAVLKMVGVGAHMNSLVTYMNIKVEEERQAQMGDLVSSNHAEWSGAPGHGNV